jgi:hypothetical protein
MNIINIPKKSGGFRKIYVVKGAESAKYKQHVGELSRYAKNLDKAQVMHGFVKNKSPITAAIAHVNHAWTVCFDLADFFDNVDKKKLDKLIPKELIDVVIVDGAARQGLPTSPSAANIAASTMDKAILRMIEKKKIDVIYTRYADDLTFSGDNPDHMEIIKREIPQIVTRCGWKLRKDKTHIQMASHGRRHICGIAVDNDGIHPTRRMKRKLRAAQHQAENSLKSKQQAMGLEEWCKLKEPKVKYIQVENSEDLNKQLKNLSKVWRIRLPTVKQIPDRGPDIIDGDLIITGDPIYMIGCSTWTTGWRSCLSHPSGQHRKGSVFWSKFPGTRMAALLSNKEKNIAGITKKVMRARAFVHTMRDGTLAYDRIYGEDGSKQELEEKLKEKGYISITKVSRGTKVSGNLTGVSKPWLDNLTAVSTNVIIKGIKKKTIMLKA